MVIAIIVVGYFAVIQTAKNKLAAVAYTNRDLQTTLNLKKVYVKKLPVFSAEIKNLQRKYRKDRQKIARKVDVASLLYQFANNAGRMNLLIASIKNLPMIQNNAMDFYPFEIVLTGDFYNLLKFFNNLAFSPYFIIVQKFSMENGKKLKITCNVVHLQNSIHDPP